MLPGQNDDWVTYPLDEFVVTTIIDVIVKLMESAGVHIDVEPAAVMASLNAKTDPDADPQAAKETPKDEDKPAPFRLLPGVFTRAPRMLFRVLRHNPKRWQSEKRSFQKQLESFQQRAKQAESLSDEDLLSLVDGIIGLFRTCLSDGVMYYGFGLVWMYWRTSRLLGKHLHGSAELTDNVAACFLQLLVTGKKNPAAPLFEHFRKLSKTSQSMGLQEFIVAVPDSALANVTTVLGIERVIFERLRVAPAGREIESRVDAILDGLPVPLERIDWPFSPRPQIPLRLLVAILSSEPIEGLDELFTEADTKKLVAKKLPLRKRSRWNWNVTKSRNLMAGAIGTIFLLLEIIPTFHEIFDEVIGRLLVRRQVDAPEDAVLLRFDEITAALLDHKPRQALITERDKELADRRTAKAAAAILQMDLDDPRLP